MPADTTFKQASLALASVLLPLTPLTALADVSAESPVVETAQAASELGANPAGFALAFAPLGVYSLFWLYREKVNPRAKISDLLFFAAALVIFGNIFSILVFKKRIY